MAHPAGTTTRVQRLTTLVAVLLMAGAVGFAFGRVYEGRSPTAAIVGAGAVAGLLAWALERRSLLLATLISAGALALVISVLIFPETTWYGAPTLETWRAVWTAVGRVGEEARLRVSPTEPIDPLLMAGIVAAWAAAFSSHALAFRAGSPLLALVPPVALVAFADSVLEEDVRPIFGVLFLIAALAVIFADAMRRMNGWGPIWTGPGRANRLLTATGRSARRIAVAAVLLAAVAPLVVPGFGAKAVIDISSLNQDDRIRVSPLVSVAAQLQRSEPIDVFEVTTDRPGYWRMTALERFDGIAWTSSGDEEGTEVPSGAQLTEPAGEPSGSTFTVLNDVGYDWLPVQARPVSVTVDAPVTWNAATETLRTDGPLDAGSVYGTVTSYPSPSRADLQLEDFPDPSAYPQLVQLPDGLPDEIGRLAQEWTAGAETDYERVVALERVFNDITRFRYELDVSPREDGRSLVEFLTVTREGFCQQFAAAMAVMLRTLGIPARVGFGYTAGSPVGDGDTWRVATDDLHAWVEVRFPTYGWLPFEPTPGRDNPAMASYAPRISEAEEGPTEEACARRNPRCAGPDATPSRPTEPIPAAPRQGEAAGGTGGGGPSLPAIVGVGVASILVLATLLVPSARALRRRLRLRRAGDEPRRIILVSYDVFADRAAELGLPRGIGDTPREYARRILRDGRVTDGRVDRLATLTTRAAYAPVEPSRQDALDAIADARVALEELRDATPLRRRLSGRLRRS
jgi:transglutaminase-like putative cysteine protease